jgi:hypothetical protein
MLRDFRNWLESELKLLGNASHHAYSFGQANMAKRALEKFDAETERMVYAGFDRVDARRILTAVELLAQQTTAEAPAFATLRDALTAALVESAPSIAADREPIDTGTSG